MACVARATRSPTGTPTRISSPFLSGGSSVNIPKRLGAGVVQRGNMGVVSRGCCCARSRAIRTRSTELSELGCCASTEAAKDTTRTNEAPTVTRTRLFIALERNSFAPGRLAIFTSTATKTQRHRDYFQTISPCLRGSVTVSTIQFHCAASLFHVAASSCHAFAS